MLWITPSNARAKLLKLLVSSGQEVMRSYLSQLRALSYIKFVVCYRLVSMEGFICDSF
jgi:hypothetical protein